MAKASKEETVKVTLELDYAEAYFLYRLLGNHITGGGEFRDASDRIYSALQLCNLGPCIGLPVSVPMDTSRLCIKTKLNQ